MTEIGRSIAAKIHKPAVTIHRTGPAPQHRSVRQAGSGPLAQAMKHALGRGGLPRPLQAPAADVPHRHCSPRTHRSTL